MLINEVARYDGEAKHDYWQAPSGTLHALASCSGGPGARRMRKVRLTRAAAKAHPLACRCVRPTEQRGEQR